MTMNRIIAVCIASILLSIIGESFRRTAHVEQLLADSQEQLITLESVAMAVDKPTIEEKLGFIGKLPIIGTSILTDAHRQRTAASYYRANYETVDSLDTELSKNQVDPALFFLSANTLFRIALQNEEVSAVVEKLDEAVQAYANLLKKEPEHRDAAYNYEFVVKFRNALAAQIKSQTLDRAAQEAERDLPPPPALHGDEGAPPIDTEEEDFNVIIPLRPEERDELMKAGSGRRPKRRG